jgi:hypothetical protein
VKLVFKSTDEQRLYARIHGNIRKMRGRAIEHDCVDCSEPADDWSHTHETDDENIWNYRPRCTRCHYIYDAPGTSEDLPSQGSF